MSYYNYVFSPYRIAILGSNGNIGSIVCKKLFLNENTILSIGFRNKDDFFKASLNEFEVVKKFIYDFENINSINEFVADNDIIINCTGVANKYLIEQCNLRNTHYIDPASSKNIKMILDNIVSNSNLLIHSTGCNPGLTELILKYIDEKYKPDEVAIFFAGNGIMSSSAIEELLGSSQNNNSSSLSYINLKKIESLSEFEINRKLPHPIGEVLCMPVISKSFFDVARSTDIKRCFFYNTFKDEKILLALLNALNHGNENKCRFFYIQELKNIYDNIYKLEKEKYTVYYCEIKIKNELKSLIFKYEHDWNELTASMIVETVNLIKNGKQIKNSSGGIWDLFHPKDFIFKLKNNKL